MKKLNLILNGNEKLTKEQMKSIVGGQVACTLTCYMYEGLDLGQVSGVGCGDASDGQNLDLCTLFFGDDAQEGDCNC
jgi:natural product precursor